MDDPPPPSHSGSGRASASLPPPGHQHLASDQAVLRGHLPPSRRCPLLRFPPPFQNPQMGRVTRPASAGRKGCPARPSPAQPGHDARAPAGTEGRDTLLLLAPDLQAGQAPAWDDLAGLPKTPSGSPPSNFKKGARLGSPNPSCRHTACTCYEGQRGWEPISRMEELCLHITSPGGPGWLQFRRPGPCALQTWGGRQAHCLRQPGRVRVSPPVSHSGRPEGPGPVPAGVEPVESRDPLGGPCPGLPLTLAAQPCIGPRPLGSSRPQLRL